MFETIDPARAARLIPLGSKIDRDRAIESRSGGVAELMIAALRTCYAHQGLQRYNGLRLTRAEVEITSDTP